MSEELPTEVFAIRIENPDTGYSWIVNARGNPRGSFFLTEKNARSKADACTFGSRVVTVVRGTIEWSDL